MQKSPTVLTIPHRLQPLAALALMLEKLERQPRQASADQYRHVAERLRELLDQAPDDPALPRILDVFPAAAEVYENLRYGQAGLCRSGLEAAVEAEQRARDVIERLRRPH